MVNKQLVLNNLYFKHNIFKIELNRYSLSSPVDFSRYYITGPSETDFFGKKIMLIIVMTNLILSYFFFLMDPRLTITSAQEYRNSR